MGDAIKYNAKKPKNRRKLRTGVVLDRWFKSGGRRPCHYCKKKLFREQATFDHVIPLSKGGYDKSDNGVIACATCNSLKGRLTKEEFLKRIALAKENGYD